MLQEEGIRKGLTCIHGIALELIVMMSSKLAKTFLHMLPAEKAFTLRFTWINGSDNNSRRREQGNLKTGANCNTAQINCSVPLHIIN